MASFFIDRPIFAAVIALFICLGGTAGPAVPRDRSVPDHRAAVDFGQHQLSRRLAGEPVQQRHAADRGRAQWRQRDSELRIDQRLARASRDHRQFRSRHRFEHGLGRSPEPDQARRSAAAARRHPAGHPDRGGIERGAADHHAELDRRKARRDRPRRFHDPQRAGRDPPHSRRRARHAILDRAVAAGLDRRRQARRLPAHVRRRDQGDRGAERAGGLGEPGRRTEPQGAADLRLGSGQGPAHHA